MVRLFVNSFYAPKLFTACSKYFLFVEIYFLQMRQNFFLFFLILLHHNILQFY